MREPDARDPGAGDPGGSLALSPVADDEPAITILHASDMQFGKHHRFADATGGFDTLLQRMCEDLDLIAREHRIEPDIVALTGDLAEWGMRSEFDQVAAFGEGLLAHLRLAPERLLVIPGNHDINRKLCESYFLRCDGDGDEPRPPYWPKWEPYVGLIHRLYRDVDRYRFTELEPWTLFEIPSLKVVVAGLNSTIRESHRDEDHHGFLGERQLRWFDARLAEYVRRGWLRVGIVHHNALRRAEADDENLRDADDLREILGERLHLLLHGHTHQGRTEMLGPALPVVSTGSAAVKRDQRPGPPDQRGETPNQYQIVRVTRGGMWCAARAYAYERKRWIGDTRVSRHGDAWWYSLDRPWSQASATFPPQLLPSIGHGTEETVVLDPDDADPDGAARAHPGHEDDLLDDVIEWCQIRAEGRLAEVTRVRHRGPWGDYAKVHDRERGIGLLGAYQGELTPDVLERWVADVHDPFRSRGQPVSKLVVAASTPLDPALRGAAQARGVDVERMIDYQRVLDTLGYTEKLRERLARDREYPSEYYLEQRMTVWSPIQVSSEKVERAADWLAARLLEHDGAFVLVLGQAGVGKTFLLREVARRLGRQQAITPILVELKDLERARTIEELAATQFTRFGVPWHPRAFRRDLEDGRLALLFDGFDELALRVRSAAIPAHFERIYAAAVERARIVVSSRAEHFLSSGQVADLMTSSSAGTTPLAGMLERVQRRDVLELHRFERADVGIYLRRRLGDAAGEARLARLSRVQDLVGLACNPRMLGFLVDIPDDKLAEAAGQRDPIGEAESRGVGTPTASPRGFPVGSITSDELYRIVVDAWLSAAAERLSPPGAAPGPDAAALRDAATHLAIQLWRDPGLVIRAEEVGAHAGQLLARMCDDDPDWATHTVRTRTLLTRDERGRIAFIHQTVLEWLVACRLAGEITGELQAAHLDFGRLNAFMIDLMRERLGDEALARWAEARLGSQTGGAGAENARDVLKRLNRRATAQAVHRDQDLRGQELGGQSLRGAILDRADLTGARLIKRDLTGASLVGAQLGYVDFTDACLRSADLRGANLAFARFHRADLTGARLAGARLVGASFLGALGCEELVDAAGVGAALLFRSPVDMMYARTTEGGCRVAISPNGSLLASGHGDGTVRLWDCARGHLVRILPGHDGRVACVAFSPDGRWVASGGADTTVRLWSAGDGAERCRLVGHRRRVMCVAFSPDGKRVASGDGDGKVRIWRVDDGRQLALLARHTGTVLSVVFSPDGRTVASGGSDNIVRQWDAESGAERPGSWGHRGAVWSVAFSPDGKTVASGGDENAVLLSRAEDGTTQRRLASGRVSCVAFSPDGRTVASGGDDHAVRLWNADDSSERARLVGHGGRVLSVAFSPDGRTVASGADDDSVRIWNARDGSEQLRLMGRGGSVMTVAFSPSGRTVASGSDDNMIRLWGAEDGHERARLVGHTGRVSCVAFSVDGKTVASAAEDNSARLWNLRLGNERMRLGEDGSGVSSVAFSPDSKTLATGADNGRVRLWSATEARDPLWSTRHVGCVFWVAFSPDGKLVASGGDDATVRLLSARDGSERFRLSGHRENVWAVAFSPDGKTLASGGDDGAVRLWTVRDGTERTKLLGHRGRVLSVAFSPDGKLVASAADDTVVRLWNASDGEPRAQLVGHLGRVLSVAFSPDGRMVASGAVDATMRLWDLATGRCLAILYGTARGTVAARPDGRYRVRGDIAGQFWHVIGLHRYDVGELDALVPGLRLGDDEPLYTLP